MQMSGVFHRGVELSMTQLEALKPVHDRHFHRGFKSLAESEEMVDKLLADAGCPIDLTLRAPTSIEQGQETNLYLCQFDDKRVVASEHFNARSLQEATRLSLEKYASMFKGRTLPKDLVNLVPGDQASPFYEASGNRWRIRIVMILPNNKPAMLLHMLIAR